MRLLQEIEEVTCVDETNSGAIIGEHGSDNMVLTGIAITPSGRAVRIPTVDVGSFKQDKAVKRFSPPKQFTAFPAPSQSTVSPLYQVLFLLAETDGGGGVGTLADELVANVNKNFDDKADGGVITGIIAKEIAKRVAQELLKAAVKRLQQNAKDDIFPPQLQQVSLTAPELRFPNGNTTSDSQTATFRGHGGEYIVRYRWRLVA